MSRLLIMAALFASAAGSVGAQEAQLTCNIGPVHRSFGGTPWIVYGCDDGRSLVVASDAGNPASPFVFVLRWTDAGYGVSGEGSGSRDASDAALSDLRGLNQEQIRSLYVEVQAAGGGGDIR